MWEFHQADGTYISRRPQTVGNRWQGKVLARKVRLSVREESTSMQIEQELRGSGLIFRGTSPSGLGAGLAPHEACYWFRVQTSLNL